MTVEVITVEVNWYRGWYSRFLAPSCPALHVAVLFPVRHGLRLTEVVYKG